MQIRQEAGLEDPEIRHERSVHAALQMSLSCEDLALVSDPAGFLTLTRALTLMTGVSASCSLRRQVFPVYMLH